MDKMVYWLQGEPEQNFGDYLSEYLLEHLFLHTARRTTDVRIIGSWLDDSAISENAPDFKSSNLDRLGRRECLVAWGAGIRSRGGLSPAKRSLVDILAVRGPLSAADLGLGETVPQGDPALFLPALYSPKTRSELTGPNLTGGAVCVPHFNDPRSEKTLLKDSGADAVLASRIKPGLDQVEAFIDQLASADFVLTASLHGAIVAAAYGRPFAFWDSGSVDLPVKWQDFAALIGIPCLFARDLEEGRTLYQTRIAPALRIPPLLPLLASAPYPLRPDSLLKILRQEQAQGRLPETPDGINEAIALFTAKAGHFADIAAESRELIRRRKGYLGHTIADLERQIVKLQAESSERMRVIDALRSSTSWKVTAPLRRAIAWLGRRSAAAPAALPAAPSAYAGWIGAKEADIEAHMAAAIRGSLCWTEPTSHMLVRDILPSDFYRTIMEAYSATESALREQQHDGDPTVFFGSYRDRLELKVPNELSSLPQDLADFWLMVRRIFSSDAVFLAIHEKFRSNFEAMFEEHDNPAELQDRLNTTFILMQHRNNYYLGPHTDRKEKIITGVFYCPESDELGHLGTTVYDPKVPGFTSDGTVHHNPDDFTKVRTIPYTQNAMLLFFRSDTFFHGVERLTEADLKGSKRSTILFNYWDPIQLHNADREALFG